MEWPAAIRDQACLISITGKTVTIECDDRGEALDLFEWLLMAPNPPPQAP